MKKFTERVYDHRVLLFVFLVSLSIKILFLLQTPVVNPDALVYIAAAQSFSEGLFEEGAKHYQMPLYPLLLAAVYYVIPDWIWAGRLFNTLILLFCIFPIYFITLRLFNKQSAIAAALLFAVLPVFNSPVNSIIRDPLFLMLSLCVLALLTYQKDSITLYGVAATAFLVVFAVLIRIEGILFFVLIPLLFIWFYRDTIGLKLMLQGLGMTALLIGLSTGVLWFFSLSGFDTHSRFNEVVIWLEKLFSLELFSGYAALYEQLKEFQGSTPHSNLKNNLVESTRHYAPLIYLIGLMAILIKEIFPTTLLAFAALKWGHRPLLNNERVIIVWPFLAFLALNLLFSMVKNFSVTRYMWIPIVLSLPFAGYGISLWWQRFEHRRVIVTMLLLLFFVAPAVKNLDGMTHSRDSLAQAGSWIKQYDSDNKFSVIFNDRRLSVYSDRISTVPHENIDFHLEEIILRDDTIEEDLVVLVTKSDQLEIYEAGEFRNYVVLKIFKDTRSPVVVLKKVN